MLIAYWKLILLTLSITELARDNIIKNRKLLPWTAIVVSIVLSLAYVWSNSSLIWPAVIHGLIVGLITTGMYKLVKDYVRAMKRA